jgi:hypothetical protein
LGQAIQPNWLNYALANPETFGMLYANETGMPMNSGNYAMSQQYANAMPTEWLMQNNLMGGADERAAYFEQNINQGMTPGSSYYSAGDFLGQAFTPGSAMYDHIWGADGTMSPDQQVSNFFGAMTDVLGPSMGQEMMDIWGARYMQSFQQYQIALANGQTDMGLADWFTSQGLGMPSQGQ